MSTPPDRKADSSASPAVPPPDPSDAQPPKEKPLSLATGPDPAPAKGVGPLLVSASVWDRLTDPPVHGDVAVRHPRLESETRTIIPPPARPVRPRRLSTSAWRVAVGGVVGILILAAVGVGGVTLFFLPGLAPTAGPPREPVPLMTTGLPPRAVAPFDAAQAKQFQEAWAEHLRLPVVRDVNLGGGVTMKLTLIPPGAFRSRRISTAPIPMAWWP